MALVITIVILIILATVAISYVFGENGLITKAQQAKEKTEIASLIERMELAEGSAYIDGRGTIDPDNYFDLLESDGIILSTEEPDVIDNEDGTYQITTEEGYVFEITLLPDKENPTNIEIEYMGKENNLGPRIREIRITGRTTNSVSIEVETRNAEGASYTYSYREVETGEWIEVETSQNNTCTIGSLEAGKAYEIQVKVETENGETTKEIGVTIGELPTGTIKFGATEWVGDGTARIKVETSEEGYTLQYQKNGTEGSWTNITSGGTIENLNHGDTVYARLWDGTNGSEHASASITDDIAPEVEISTSNLTSNSVRLNVTANDAQSGLATSGTYAYYLGNELKATSETNSYTFTGLTDGTQYTLKVVVTDKAGKTTEKSTTVTTEAVPDGTVEGAIKFGNTTWSNEIASVTVSTSTSYTIEYQVNGTSGTWTEIASGGTIGNLSHENTVYARLTDGSNTGEYASASITDDIAPEVEISTSNLTSNSVRLNVTASDAQSGLAESGTYKYYLGNELKVANETNSYTFTGLKDGTQYILKVIVTDKAGKTTEKSTTVTTATVPDGTVSGAITFGSTTWSNGTANVKVSTNTSYTIQYQVNSTSGTWTTIASGGTIGNLSHGNIVYARLTDGSNIGNYASVSITDTIAPTVSISTSNLTSNSVKLTVTASDAQSGLATSGTYKYYLGNELKVANETNSYTFTGLKYATQYTLKVVVTDKAGKTTEKSTTITTASIAASSILEEGDYVNYVDKNGTTRKCVVLYGPANANYSTYGIQIITMETVEKVELGNGTGNIKADNDPTYFETAKNSYNNTISTLHTKAQAYLNTTYASGVRSVGSIPNNPTYDGANSTTVYGETFKQTDSNYLNDWNQMNSLAIQNINQIYWLASREIDGAYYGIRKVDRSGSLYYYIMCELRGYSSKYSYSVNSAGLRPVFTLKSGIKITGGSGTSSSPYTLGT